MTTSTLNSWADRRHEHDDERRVGMLISVSTARMIRKSSRPPRRPAIPPRMVPITT
jgi:hypothetical protein